MNLQAINDNDIHSIVLSYLIHNCYKESAESFIACTGMKQPTDYLVDMEKRKSRFLVIFQCRRLIQDFWLLAKQYFICLLCLGSLVSAKCSLIITLGKFCIIYRCTLDNQPLMEGCRIIVCPNTTWNICRSLKWQLTFVLNTFELWLYFLLADLFLLS